MEKQTHEVTINTARCTGCGLCVSDCVAGALSLENGTAKLAKAGCIFCGHCEAICPQNAVALTGFEEEPVAYKEQTRLDPEQLLLAIKTRRSIRSFTKQPVPADVIDRILEAGRLAPTAKNSQKTGYIIAGSRQGELEERAVLMFRRAGRMIPALRNMTIDDYFFFKGAPLVIVVTGEAVDASLAAQNMAFMAEACGLGVMFSGYFTFCANQDKKLRGMMQMEEQEKAVTTLVIGYPAIKYRRTVRREPARVRRL